MRNDVSFPPPDPSGNVPPTPPAAASSRVNPRLGAVHPHTPDRAHGLDKLSDRTTTDAIYEMPETRGGIDSLTLSIIVVAGVAVALLVAAYLFYSRL